MVWMHVYAIVCYAIYGVIVWHSRSSAFVSNQYVIVSQRLRFIWPLEQQLWTISEVIPIHTYIHTYTYIYINIVISYLNTILHIPNTSQLLCILRTHTYSTCIHAYIYTYSVSLTWTAVREWRCFCHHPIIECPSAYCRTLTADPSESTYIHT